MSSITWVASSEISSNSQQLASLIYCCSAGFSPAVGIELTHRVSLARIYYLSGRGTGGVRYSVDVREFTTLYTHPQQKWFAKHLSMLDYIPLFSPGVRTRADYRFGRLETSSLAVRPSELVENNRPLSNFKHGIP